jgi:prefoldin alpha subunit
MEDKYQQMQMMDYQVKQLQKVIENIDAQLVEITTTIEALTEFAKVNENDEILFPVANGIFAKGKLTDNKILKINIGSNTVVEKNISDTIKMMEVQSKDIQSYRIEVMTQLQSIMDKMNQLQGE